MNRKWIFLPLLAAAALAQTKSANDLKLWSNGVGLALHTESSTANSPLSTSGSVVVGDGADSHRVVLDKSSNPIFAYDIELRRSNQGAVIMRIKPIDQEKARSSGWFPKDRAAGDVPTLAATREFPPLHEGDAIQVDILYNPASGEKLWDVLRVIADPPPSPRPAKPSPGDRFSFEQVKVVVDGKTVAERRNTWMIGLAMMMRLPGRGEYYLLLTPSPDFPFQASGWVDHHVLRFHAGSELVEIIGQSNMLQQSDYGTVWVYHVPEARASIRGSSVDFSCADNLEQLLPRTKAKEE